MSTVLLNRRRFRNRLRGVTSRERKRRARQGGFALIEVLVGLAIVGVISSLTMAFLGQARAIMRIESATELAMEVDAAVAFLEEAITAAEPLPLRSSPPADAMFFRGDASQLEFTSVQAIGFGTSALREIKVAFRPAGLVGQKRPGRIILQSRRRGSEATGEPTILLEGTTALSFEFLDPDGKSWMREWNLSRRLPRAVRFKVSVSRDGMGYSSQGLARPAVAFY